MTFSRSLSRILILALFAMALASAPSFAADGTNYASLMMGASLPSDSSAAFTYGIGGGRKITPIWAIGATYFRYSLGVTASDSSSTITVNSAANAYAAVVDYIGSGTLQGGIFGIKIGLMSVSGNASAQTSSSSFKTDTQLSGLFVAPKAGYEQLVSGRISVGGEASYLYGLNSRLPRGLELLALARFGF